MAKEKLPAWTGELKSAMIDMAETLLQQVRPWQGPAAVYRPEQFGLRREKATQAIQAAIDAAAEHGGTVRLEQGDYTSGTLALRSGVRLMVCAGARLLGSTDLNDYPEMHAKRLTVQDTSMGMHQSLIFAEGCENIGICGAGIIDGQGSPEHFPGAETAQGTPGRPFLIRVIDCRGVHISGITLKNAACWMQNYLNCDRLLIEGITVRNHANYNNDGMDIDGCRDVVIRDCRVSSGDDALCFKGASQRETARVLVQRCDFYSACNAVKVGTDTQGDFRQVMICDCRIGGLIEDPSGLKHPCADSGISLEMLDGGTLEDFWITNLHISRAWSPFFFRLENRGRVKPGDPIPGPGTLRRVLISDITGSGNGPRGSYLLGIPEAPIRDIVFEHIALSQYSWTGAVPDAAAYPDLRGVYPDAHMIDGIGPVPAYGFWARHARNLTLREYAVTPEGPDSRPAVLLEDTARELDILGENRFERHTKTRLGSRAIIVRDGRILLSHEKNSDLWLLPGGGLEEGETPEDCCIREAQEETGYIIRPVRRFLILNEYYEEYRYISHYFVCEILGQGPMRLTEQERLRGAHPEWLPLEEAIALFSRHADYADTNEEKRGIYLREYMALQAYHAAF